VHGFGDKDLKILSEFARLVSALSFERDALSADALDARLCEAQRQMALLPWRHPKWNEFLREFLGLASRATGQEHCFLAVRDHKAGVFVVEGSSQPLFSPASQTPGSFPLGGGMIGWVFKHAQPVHALDSETTPARLFGAQASAPVFRSVVCQPVIYGRDTRAVLVLAGQEEAIGEPVKDFAASMAGQLALFLENLHLKARLAKRKA